MRPMLGRDVRPHPGTLPSNREATPCVTNDRSLGEMALRSWSKSAGSVTASLYYHVSGKTQMQTVEVTMFITATGAGKLEFKAGRGR